MNSGRHYLFRRENEEMKEEKGSLTPLFELLPSFSPPFDPRKLRLYAERILHLHRTIQSVGATADYPADLTAQGRGFL